ncbi:MAG: flavohemoprotein [Actinophytocola sp.]|nr:flavohemoprotein [Actinophytocola sp.]
MTVNPVLDEPEEPSGSSSARQRNAERVVGIIRESFAKIEPNAEGVSRQFYALLFAIAPDTRDMFPANMEVQRSRLLRALVHIVQMVDRPQELTPFLRQLGRDHRKFGVVTKHYESVGTALLGALRHYAGDDWTEEVERAWADAFAIIAGAMQEGSAADDGPAWWNAEVVGHTRLDWETALVRVQSDRNVPFYTGQYVSVECPQRPRLWRYLSPANAPREDGTMDFHVRAVDGGWVSRALVGHTRLGDVWRVGAPLGNLWSNPKADRDLLLVGGGTGIAPLLGVIDELSGRDTRPYVTMFFGGRKVDDLYYLGELRALAERHSWLTVVPVTEDGSADGGEKGQLAEVVTGHGAWRDHDVLVSGSPGMIRSTVSRMLVTGTTFDQISYDSFTTD